MKNILQGVRRVFAAKPWTLDRLDYNDYWNRREHDVYQPRFALIARMVPDGSTVADIGCGDGSLLRFLAKSKHTAGWGVDISDTGVVAAQAEGTDCVVGDITTEDFKLPSHFDCVIVSEVLEHVPDPERVIARLREQGVRHLIVTLPNTGYLEHRLRLLFGRFPVQWLLHPGEHLRFWTVSDFRLTANTLGFGVQSVTPALGWYPFARWWPSSVRQSGHL